MTKFFQLITLLAFSFLGQQSAFAQCQVTQISSDNNAVFAYTCPQDGTPDVVNFFNNNTLDGNYAYAITNADKVVLAIEPNDFHDFDNAPPGNCFVWGFSYTGNLIAQPGSSVFSTRFSDECYAISQNYISVIRETPDGGTVATPDGKTSIYACLNDGFSDFVGFSNTSNSAASYRYVITDDQNNILGLPPTSFLDFSGAGVGTCRVWGLSYTGNLTAQVGQNAAAVALSDNCFELSSNFITVDRNEVEGGRVTMPNGETYRETITQDGTPDIVMFTNTSTAPANYAYVITKENHEILEITTDSQMDFDGAPPGTCRVWGFSYSGTITAQPGENVFATNFSSGCFEISSSAITVYRKAGTPTGVDGGTVAMPSGATMRYTCPGDGTDDIVMFTTTSTSTNYAYVVTDDMNNILALPPSNQANFEGAPAGTCRVWGLAYTGNITATVGDNAAAINLSDDQFDLSDNFITVIRDTPNAGTVATADGQLDIQLCAGDGIDDIVEFSHAGNSNSKFAYVITDDQNNILGIPPGNSQNFEGAGQGVCRVWGLSYTGTITAQPGDNAANVALSDDCFDLSDNFVTIDRIGIDAGEVSLASGGTTYAKCAGDIVFDVQNSSSVTNSSYWYIITDANDNILDWHNAANGNTLDLSAAPAGECHVWGWSYRGLDDPIRGENISTLADERCEAISSNWITVYREVPDGGMVSLTNGDTTYAKCAGDIVFDVQHTTTAPNLSYWYIITDANDNILDWANAANGNTLDLSGAPAGECHVWGWNYRGLSDPIRGENISTLADDFCESISDNWITVYREVPDGGMVSLANGETSYEACAGNIVFDVQHTTTAPNLSYWYIITDANDNILDWANAANGNTLDLSGAPAGECHVWGWNYRGLSDPIRGENISTLADDFCESISDNWITVTRIANDIDGGTVAMPNGETTRYTCAQDGNADIIMFTHTTTSASNYGYIITDDQNNILGIPPGDFADVDAAPPGNCRVWGFSYTGDVLVGMGDNAATATLTDGCFALSSNFIEVIRDNPEGGTVETIDGETALTITAGDGVDDIVEFTHAGNSNSNFTYVITDDQNNILGIPPGNSQNFEGAGVGVCRVWGLSYTGTITAQPGDNAAQIDLTDDCFDLSDNFIEVTRVAQKPISNITFAKAKVSPNPVLDRVTFELEMKEIPVEEMTRVSVYNTAGIQVHFAEFATWEGANNFQLNLGHLREGIYKVVLQNGQTYSNVTFVKNRL